MKFRLFKTRENAQVKCMDCGNLRTLNKISEEKCPNCGSLYWGSKNDNDYRYSSKPLHKIPAQVKQRKKQGLVKQSKHKDNFYNSRTWRELRWDAFNKFGRHCCSCGAKPSKDNDVVLHVDHIKPRSRFPELALNLENLQILCKDCNLGKGNRDSVKHRN